jgi:hypothetical protein
MILRFDSSVAPLKIIALEKSVYSPIDITFKGKGQKIIAGGFIDRLDIVDGMHRIIDYKTGNIAMKIGSVESLFEEADENRNEAWFQILMYCEIFSLSNPEVKVRPSLYSLRNLSDRGFSDLLIIGKDKDSPMTVNDYSLIRETFSAGLKATIEKILDPRSDFIMTEHTRKCEYCTYRQLCNR